MRINDEGSLNLQVVKSKSCKKYNIYFFNNLNKNNTQYKAYLLIKKYRWRFDINF
ncbi:hypothetical protein GCM10022393_23260 [Aquimarina addita]|uniref:Uncharacterized protein n=1 Tax=Aquimarina addita TaxID=870485 RepID=A0ABP6UNS0_9FLAO